MSGPTVDSIAEIRLVDKAGTVLVSAPLPAAAVPPAAPVPERSVPTNLDWYRDATKWLVTISGAAIVFGYGFVAGSAEYWPKLAFTVSSAILLISILGGIVCHFWILKWANAFEALALVKDATKEAALTASKTKAATWLQRWYHVMMWPFFAGMVSFTAFCGYLVWQSKAPDHKQPVVLVGGNNSGVVYVDHDGKAIWVLKQAGTKYVWEKVAAFPR